VVDYDVAFQSGTELFGFSMISSTKVFHAPHDGHLPNHLGASKPQLWQKYAILDLAIYLDANWRDTNISNL